MFWLGLAWKPMALAWVWVALASRISRPSQGCWLWLGFGLAWPKPWPEAGKIWQCVNILYIAGIQSLSKSTITYPDPSQHRTLHCPHPLLKTDSPNLLPRHHRAAR